ncbi:Bis(5'-nucleosyl)-tetraphosphatase, symmetrical [Halioglobus japonicus]|nr:Bis(5'-nucleosyl)-tetraphosphatase, symmetrical [Halioglobus japonicus]
MNMAGYDLIGDIHGHGTALLELLEHLGYVNTADGYLHSKRKAVFLGDFIDRGPEQRLVLDTVMPMVRNGNAYAVMGNHEFNALAFSTQHKGQPLREHSHKNIHQHQAFLDEYDNDPSGKREVLEFFYQLPLWLEIDGIRVIHACWHDRCVELLKSYTGDGLLCPTLLAEAATQGTDLYKAVEVVLKGYEVELPDGITFRDKDGHPRAAVRIGWWNRKATQLEEVAQPVGIDIQHAGKLPIPSDAPSYDEESIPCFVGHYWLRGEQDILARNVACVDYSVAKGGRLVSYRWRGERELTKANFSYADRGL